MWPATAVLVVGDDLLGTSTNDAQSYIPIRAIGGDAQLEDRISVPGILTMLEDEHRGAAARYRLVEETRAPDEGIDFGVEPRDHRAGTAAGLGFQRPYRCRHSLSRSAVHRVSAILPQQAGPRDIGAQQRLA